MKKTFLIYKLTISFHFIYISTLYKFHILNFPFKFLTYPEPKEIIMKEENENKSLKETTPDNNRQWIAPEFTELNSRSTAGGPVTNTEAFNYHPNS
jgi:hypothetical protein